jgi:hypothetical protein
MAKVPLRNVRNPDGVLAFTKANPLNHIQSRKPMSGRLRKISMPTRIQEVILFRRGE